MSIPNVSPYPVPTADELPCNRVDWQPDPKRAMLLVHDMQHYFLRVYSSDTPPLTNALANTTRLHTQCKTLGMPVVFTAQPQSQSASQRGLLNDMWGPGLTEQPELADIHSALPSADDDRMLIKHRYSAFQQTDLQHIMAEAGRDQLIICGVYGHIGCLLTAAEAFMNDIQPFLVADAIADFSAADHAMALDYVAKRCGVVMDTDGLLEHFNGATAAESLESLRRELASMLECPANTIGDHDNLVDLGLDSIRAMTLAERWQACGLAIEFTELADNPTLAAWWQVLANARHGTEASNV